MRQCLARLVACPIERGNQRHGEVSTHHCLGQPEAMVGLGRETLRRRQRDSTTGSSTGSSSSRCFAHFIFRWPRNQGRCCCCRVYVTTPRTPELIGTREEGMVFSPVGRAGGPLIRKHRIARTVQQHNDARPIGRTRHGAIDQSINQLIGEEDKRKTDSIRNVVPGNKRAS